MIDIANQVSSLSTRLQALELKNEADEHLISLLKRQNFQQDAELTKMRHDHDIALQKLRQERDIAIRTATEVEGIITALGTMALSGIRKMRGDDTPEVIPDRKTPSTANLRTALPSIDVTPPDDDDRLPRPLFLDRPRDHNYEPPARAGR